MDSRLWSILKIVVPSLISFVCGYFVPNNSFEKAVECFIKEETGIEVDFHPDPTECPVDIPFKPTCGDHKRK
jgi:hypothetical protein